MRRAVRRSRTIFAGALLLAAMSAPAAHAASGDVELLSRAGTGSGNGASTSPSTTQDGRFTAFLSRATNLTADTVSGAYDQAFVRDAQSGTTVLASTGDGPGGLPADAAVSNVSISDDGRWVIFQTAATSLVDTSLTAGVQRTFVRDVTGGRTYLVDGNTTDDAVRPAIAADGSHVAFASHGNYDGASGASLKVYVRTLAGDGALGAPVWASRKDGVAGGLLTGDYPRLAGDGSEVVFLGNSPAVDPAYPGQQLFVRYLFTGTTDIVSRADGDAGDPSSGGNPTSEYPAVSRDGRFVAFASAATNLSDADADPTADVFRRDLVANTTTLVSRADGAAGAAADQNAGEPSISDDGKRVLFLSGADNLSTEDNNNGTNAFLRDLATGTTTWIHGAPHQTPAPQGVMAGVSLSGDGHWAAFDTNATLLAGQESGTYSDVFRRDMTPPAVVVPPPSGGGGDTSPPPPPPPPPAVHEHTLLGFVRYQPSFAPGADGQWQMPLSASPFHGRHTVRLLDAAGRTLQEALVDAAAPTGPSYNFDALDFEFDGLPACQGCTLALDEDRNPAADRVPVTFTGEPGQTEIQLNAGRLGQGGTLTGSIVAPQAMNPRGLSVRVLDASGKVLADTARATVQCLVRPGDHGVPCSAATTFTYRLTGLPQDGSAATVELLQTAVKGATVVDTAETTLGQDAYVDTLGALDFVPSKPRGRVVYGHVATQAPYAPGSARNDDLLPDPKDRPLVDIVHGDKVIAHAAVTAARAAAGPGGRGAAPAEAQYEIDQVPACPSGCSLVLHVGRQTRRTPVTVPSRTPSVVREDLRYPATGTAEFLEGDVWTYGAAHVRVKVTDAASGKVLADSATLPALGCGSARCKPAGSVAVGLGDHPYRLGGLPAGRPVVVTLFDGSSAVDTESLTTAPAGDTTSVPVLSAPPGRSRGRMLSGVVTQGLGFAPGASSLPVDPTGLGVRLVDAAGHLRAKGIVSRATRTSGPTLFAISDAPACAGCFAELLTKEGAVSDRTPVTVPDASPSSTDLTLANGALLGGRWVDGTVTFTNPVAPRDVEVRLVTADTRAKLSGSTDRDVIPCSGTRSGTARGAGQCPSGRSFDYRLGHVPAGVEQVVVQILLRGKIVASTTVTLGPDAPGAMAGSLRAKSPSTRPTSGKA